MPSFKRRWVVRVRNVQGRLVNEKRFVRKGAARAYRRWMDTTAVGGHKWQAQVPPGNSPIWTTEMEKERS